MQICDFVIYIYLNFHLIINTAFLKVDTGSCHLKIDYMGHHMVYML